MNNIQMHHTESSNIAVTTGIASKDGYCTFKYPSGFSKSRTLLLCVKYINSNSRPVIEHRDADLWDGDFSVNNMSVTVGKEVIAVLVKIPL